MKEWLINFGIKMGIDKAGPSAIRGGFLGVIGWLVIKNNLIPGINTDAATHITTIAWDQVQTWAIAGLPAVTAFAIKFLQVHTTTAVKAMTAEKQDQGGTIQ